MKLKERVEGDIINEMLFIKHVGVIKKHLCGVFECPLCKKHFTCAFGRVEHNITKSCGCLKKEGNNFRHGYARTKKQSTEYRIWSCIIDRCENNATPAYKDYGGRGISICERWRNSFSDFLSDVGFRPSKKHTFDRFPDNNGNYEPRNFRWATKKEQARNTRRTLFVEYRGETKTLSELCETAGLKYRSVWHRVVKEGKSVEWAINTPFRKFKKRLKPGNFISHSFGSIAA